MPKDELDGLPVIEVPESENITVAVKPDDLQEGDEADPEQHPIAIGLRRQRGIDDARVSKREVLIRRGDHGSGMARQSGCHRTGRTRSRLKTELLEQNPKLIAWRWRSGSSTIYSPSPALGCHRPLAMSRRRQTSEHFRLRVSRPRAA
jgi:hypothetical protein